MMGFMLIVVMIVGAVLLFAAVASTFVFATRQADARARSGAARTEAERLQIEAATTASVQVAVDAAVTRAVTEARLQASSERDAAVQAALEQAATMNREQLSGTAAQLKEQTSADLGAKKDLIDSRLDQVHAEMRTELAKVAEMLSSLNETSARKFGEVESSLKAHMAVATTLTESTQALRSALANPQARGQWGERMAEDVLRLAGFVENVNYRKQVQIDGGSGRPDYTFPMPKGKTLFMDVKFPMAAYLRYLEADTDTERDTHLKRFLADVRARVRELAKREYAIEAGGTALDNVLLFIPNEQITAFIHEHDPALIEDAMGQQIVMCSPLTLFAFLGVVRQAHDNFTIEQTSDEILSLIGTFGTQWGKYSDQMDKIKRRFESVEKDFEALTSTRKRALERPLRDLEAIRQERGLPVEGDPFVLDATDDDDETPPGGNVSHLGA